MQNLIPADFNGTAINIIDHQGQRWLTSEEVGRCLGYDHSNARKGVWRLYERHGDEFTEADTCVVNLATQGQGRAMRVFSATGCIKLGFFANTVRAKDFRAWASKVLAGEPQAVPAVTPQQAFAVDIARKLADELGEMRRTIDAQGAVITALYGKVEGAQRAQISALRSLATLRQRQATREAVETVIRLEAQGVPRAEIVALTGKTLNHVKQIVFQARASGRLPPLASTQGELALESQQ